MISGKKEKVFHFSAHEFLLFVLFITQFSTSLFILKIHSDFERRVSKFSRVCFFHPIFYDDQARSTIFLLFLSNESKDRILSKETIHFHSSWYENFSHQKSSLLQSLGGDFVEFSKNLFTLLPGHPVLCNSPIYYPILQPFYFTLILFHGVNWDLWIVQLFILSNIIVSTFV